jgi:hypothetical protein
VKEMIILIGGLQKNQAIKTDGICTTLTSSIGMGGGYIPLVIKIEKDETNANHEVIDGR